MIRSRQSRQKAQNILDMFSVKEPPVDVDAIAERLGFTVLPFDFPEDTSAVLLIEGDSKAIGVNSAHARVRQRFSVAHELGHYLSGHEDFSPRGEGETIRVDGQYDFSDRRQRLEQEANEFAAELLMPGQMLRKDVLELQLDAGELARRYEVSEQAMWIQLIDLKLTPSDAGVS